MRLHFLQGEQRKFIDQIYKVSGCSTKELAENANVHPRTFSDWKNERLRMSREAAEYFNTRYLVELPEDIETLTKRWKEAQRVANKIGGLIGYQKYGEFATPEGRKKGGAHSYLRRREKGCYWRKYSEKLLKPEPSEELAEFIGIMLGDGGLSDFQCTIYLNSDVDKKYGFYVQKLMRELFGLEPTITKREGENLLRVSISSRDLVEYLIGKGLLIGNKVKLQVDVPEWVGKNDEFVKACIRGLIDTDGCLVLHRYKVNGIKYQYPKISFCNRSEPLLEFVFKRLQGLGFNPKKTYKYIYLHRQYDVKRYIAEIGVRNYKPAIKTYLEGC